MARLLAVPPSASACDSVTQRARADGQRIFGNSLTNPNPNVIISACPPTPGATVVLNVAYTANLFMGNLIPGQQTFVYRGVAIAVIERDSVELQ